jgi:RimJ/RimL family protein N-acetyltransferase
MPVMSVPKAIANAASCRISEKQGMRMVGIVDREYVSGRLPSEIWEITTEEWRWRKKGPL